MITNKPIQKHNNTQSMESKATEEINKSEA